MVYMQFVRSLLGHLFVALPEALDELLEVRHLEAIKCCSGSFSNAQVRASDFSLLLLSNGLETGKDRSCDADELLSELGPPDSSVALLGLGGMSRNFRHSTTASQHEYNTLEW